MAMHVKLLYLNYIKLNNIFRLFLKILPLRFQILWNRIEVSNIGSRIAKGTFYSLSGAIISRVLGLISSVIVARIIGKIGFGELGIIQSTIGMLGTMAGMGMGITATKYIAEYREIDKLKAGRIIHLSNVISFFFGLIMTIALFFSASWVAKNTLSAPTLSNPLKIGSIILLFSSLVGAQNGILSGLESFKKITVINIWTGIATFPMMLLGAYFFKLNGLIFALIGSQLFNLIINRFILKKELLKFRIVPQRKGQFKVLNILWKYSLPAVLGGIVVSPIMWLGNAILVNQPNGYAEMGIFSAANQWRTALMFIPTALMASFLPIISNENSNKQNFLKTFDYVHKINIIVILPFFLIITIISSFIMNLYGKSFGEGYLALIVVIAATTISGIGTPAGIAMQAKGKMWLGFIMNLSWGIVFSIAAYLFIPKFGALGLSLSFLVSYTFLTIWGYIYLKSFLSKKILLRTLFVILIIIVCSMIMGLIHYQLNI